MWRGKPHLLSGARLGVVLLLDLVNELVSRVKVIGLGASNVFRGLVDDVFKMLLLLGGHPLDLARR